MEFADEDGRAAQLIARWHDAGLPTDLHLSVYSDDLVLAVVRWVETGRGDPDALLRRATREYGGRGFFAV